MVKVDRVPEPHPVPYYDLDGYYLSLASAGTAKEYEEGTWTPTISFGGSSTGVTYGTRSGQYVKVGALVYVRFALPLTSNGTGTGAAVIGGLPFAPAANSGAVLSCAFWSGCASVVGNPFATPAVGATTASLNMSGGTGSVAMTDTNITDTAILVMSGCYVAA